MPDPSLSTHLDGVPGAAQRRGVGQVEVADGVGGHAVEDGGGGDVDAFGDFGVPVAEQLDAEEPAGGLVAGEVRFVLADRKGTSAYYRINEACVDCFPTAADLVMGKPAPRPLAATRQ
jgi:hypothetical protein